MHDTAFTALGLLPNAYGETVDGVIHRGLTHGFKSILVLLVPLQKNQEMLHTKITYY